MAGTTPGSTGFWGIWNFSPNKAAAKSLLAYLSTRSSVEKLVNASQGYDVPPFEKLTDFNVWAEAEPPKGTLYNFPPRGDTIVSVTGYPAPPKLGVADVFARHDVQDDRQMHAGRPIDRRGDRLCAIRARRLLCGHSAEHLGGQLCINMRAIRAAVRRSQGEPPRDVQGK